MNHPKWIIHQKSLWNWPFLLCFYLWTNNCLIVVHCWFYATGYHLSKDWYLTYFESWKGESIKLCFSCIGEKRKRKIWTLCTLKWTFVLAGLGVLIHLELKGNLTDSTVWKYWRNWWHSLRVGIKLLFH